MKSIDALRFLGLDMVDEANSGHPGMVLGAAPMVYQLFAKHMHVDPKHPTWFNRDRFILSAGHGSALLYALLHLSGFDLTLGDLKAFRQIGSKTPGHPEFHDTPGVDATTGPLGQGTAHAVGMAIAESFLRNKFNQPDFSIVDHYTYVLSSDGDLQEGVAMEALALAGHLKLSKLIILMDSNDVQLDGPTLNSTSTDIKKMIESFQFHYQYVDDANDLDALETAIQAAKASDKPSFIEVKSIIGFQSSKAGTSAVHGSPLGKEETERLRGVFDYQEGRFEVAKDVYHDYQVNVIERGQKAHHAWQTLFDRYQKAYPTEAKELHHIIDQKTPSNLADVLKLKPCEGSEATRTSIGVALEELSAVYPALMGGSADLSGSTKVKGADGPFSKNNRTGRNLNFGVREHAMAAIVNGMNLHHIRGMSGGFFTFSDYMKPSMRLAAIMGLPSLFIFTHDSVAIGEDGPTHQPVEHLAQFRSTPNMQVFRPADANETRLSLRLAVETLNQPSVLVLTRQNLPVVTSPGYDAFKVGGYLLSEVADPEGILIASGSEVSLALDAQSLLKERGIHVNVVSMPSLDRFVRHPKAVQEKVLPKEMTKRLAIELGSPGLWYQVSSEVMGLDRFGLSGPDHEILKTLGFTPEKVVERYLKL